MTETANLPTKWLARKLRYKFSDKDLFQAALTHRSAGSENNERLEFLGDAILGFLVAKNLYNAFPEVSEGALTRRRAALVCRESLSLVAMEIGLGDQIRLGSGELKSGGYRRDSILADSFEALLGAIYLDGGLQPATEIIDQLFDRRMRELPGVELKDPKTRLQEYLQSAGHDLPAYEIVEKLGEAHNQTFKVTARVEALKLTGEGTGSSRRRAEQGAAEDILNKLEND